MFYTMYGVNSLQSIASKKRKGEREEGEREEKKREREEKQEQNKKKRNENLASQNLFAVSTCQRPARGAPLPVSSRRLLRYPRFKHYPPLPPLPAARRRRPGRPFSYFPAAHLSSRPGRHLPRPPGRRDSTRPLPRAVGELKPHWRGSRRLGRAEGSAEKRRGRQNKTRQTGRKD